MLQQARENRILCRSIPPTSRLRMTPPTEPARRPDVVVVVPCYNEARRLDVQAFDDFLSRSPEVALLFVDDGSTDDTPLVMERLRQQHRRNAFTLRLNSNVGKGEAVRRGIQIALRRRPAFVGYWDADLATPLDALSQLCNVLRAKPEVRLAMGSRVAMLGRDIQRSGVRHLLGRAFATAASNLLRLPVYDTQCGAKLFRATPQVAALFAEPFRSRWIFDVEILARMTMGRNAEFDAPTQINTIYEFPLEHWRDVAGSRLGARDFVTAAVELLGIYRQYVRSANHTASAPQIAVPVAQSTSTYRKAA